MMKHSNIQPLSLCVYRYPDNLELKLQKINRQISSLPYISEAKTLRKTRAYSFSSYIPREAPFVVGMIKVLVNVIEKASHKSGNWGTNAVRISQVPNVEKVAKKMMLSGIDDGQKMAIKIVQEKNIEFVLSLFRNILKPFQPSLIHFLNMDLLPVTSSPLYDSTMRPNPKFKSVVKHSVLRSSRTIIDTAAFVMIHLFHIWEYSMNMQEAKKQIVENFGKLLVSFECTPKLIDRNDITAESCLLGIILETTNVPFWNSLTGHRIFEAFDNISSMERQIRRKVKKNHMFPNIPEIMKYDIPHLQMPIHYFFRNAHDSATDVDDTNTFSTMEEDDDFSE